MIIDIHMHIGNILEPQGGRLIDRTGIPYPTGLLLRVDDVFLYRRNPFTIWIGQHMYRQITREERARNQAATLENCRAMMNRTAAWDRACGGNGHVLACVQPIAPHVTYADVTYAATQESRLQAWACPDFTLPLPDMLADLEIQAVQNAGGMKIHPIIQCVGWQDERLLAAISMWHKPVLFHTGSASYYPPREAHRQRPEFSDPVAAGRLISQFPNIPIILGHAGLSEMKEWAAACAKYDNVHVDASFHEPREWQWLVNTYGSQRVMYASDWPYGRAITSLKAAAQAFDGEQLERVLWRNAAALLEL